MEIGRWQKNHLYVANMSNWVILLTLPITEAATRGAL